MHQLGLVGGVHHLEILGEPPAQPLQLGSSSAAPSWVTCTPERACTATATERVRRQPLVGPRQASQLVSEAAS